MTIQSFSLPSLVNQCLLFDPWLKHLSSNYTCRLPSYTKTEMSSSNPALPLILPVHSELCLKSWLNTDVLFAKDGISANEAQGVPGSCYSRYENTEAQHLWKPFILLRHNLNKGQSHTKRCSEQSLSRSPALKSTAASQQPPQQGYSACDSPRYRFIGILSPSFNNK